LLDAVIEQIEKTGLAVELVDPEWKLVWVSPELRKMLGGADDEALGVGSHYLETREMDVWSTLATEEGQRGWTREVCPFVAHATPGGRETLIDMCGDLRRPIVAELEPREAPPLYTTTIEVNFGSGPTGLVGYTMIGLRDDDGGIHGTVLLYTSPLPATVLAFVARGDEAMFGRMAELVSPETQAAAIMFADIDSSGVLSRRLPSSAYFRLLARITTAVDEEVGRRKGIVGKHAGDGVTAFFLAGQAGSESTAARAAVETAKVLSRTAGEVAAELADEGLAVKAEECRLNVGIHWGGTLYMGQIVTGGRLEVTALGDEVNECARIEQTASDGRLLASKALIEHLSPEDADAVDIDPERLAYRTLAELEGASDKAVRDAGGLPVTEIEPSPAS
jgi:class 3 adenylate cyclase